MTKRLPRVVVGVRKATTPDEELKIIVFVPSFVLHLINEVHTSVNIFATRIIQDSPAPFAFATLSRIRFVIPLHHFCTSE
jgi:hypothetical protein